MRYSYLALNFKIQINNIYSYLNILVVPDRSETTMVHYIDRCDKDSERELSCTNTTTTTNPHKSF